MDNQELFNRVWGHLLRVLRAEVEKSNESRVAKRLGVSHSTVNRWLSGERGERVELSHCLRIIANLGGDLVALAKELGYEDVAKILEFDHSSRTVLLDVIAILEQGGPAADKLLQEVQFLQRLAGDSGDRSGSDV